MFNELLKKISDNAYEKVKAPDDYISPETGLLMCGLCHTPKQTKVEGFDFIGYTMCKCQREAHDAEEAKLKERADREKKEQRRSDCFRLSEKVKAHTFESDDSPDSEISNRCRKYAENFDLMLKNGRGLVLFGTVGTGKSFYAAAICNKVIDNGFTASYRSLSDIAPKLSSIDEDERDDAFFTLTHSDLIVFDDFGVERMTDFMKEGIQRAVNIRYETGKPMIFTTNYTSDELKRHSEISEQRLFSRLYETCDFIRVDGADRRKTAYAERHKTAG